VQIVRQALKDDPSILRDALAAMSADDSHRKESAAANAIAAQQAALVSTKADQVVGNPNGDVTVVEFYDPRCPYCRQMLPVMAALVKADPQVRLVFKDIPILGPASVLESRALLAAQRQGGYMRMQDAIMHSGTTPSPASLRAEAERLGMNGAQFDRDLVDPAIQARLDENLRLAAALHVEGTPAIVVGTRMLPGAVELAELQEAVGAARTQ
jgi:protein-disulfide isomerase